PYGGPATCPWALQGSNCGPNDEIFSFHSGGVNLLYLDGHVSFTKDTIPAGLFRRLVTAHGSIPGGIETPFNPDDLARIIIPQPPRHPLGGLFLRAQSHMILGAMNGTLRKDLLPLVQVFDRFIRRTDPASVPLLGRRFRAVLSARERFVKDQFLETASEADFAAALQEFYDTVVPVPLFRDEVLRRAGLARFALNHLCGCSDPLPQRLDRILAP